jgi:hypothetical protein
VTLFRALTGQLPFVSRHWFHTVTQHMYRTPPLPRALNPAIPDEVETLILRALEKRPDDRFASMRALADAAAATSDSDEASTMTTRLGIASPALARSRMHALLLAGCAAALLVAGVWWEWPEPAVAAAPPPPTRAERVRAASVDPPPPREAAVVEAPPIEIEDQLEPPRSATLIPPPPPRRELSESPTRKAKPVPPRAPRLRPPVRPVAVEAPVKAPVAQKKEPATPAGLRIEEVKNPFE